MIDTVIPVVVGVVQDKFPSFAGGLVLLQGIGWLLARFLPKNTIAAKIGGKVAAFPMPHTPVQP